MTRKEKRLAKERAKQINHRHKYAFYRECSCGMSPDAGCVWEEWRCERCGDIIRRNERVLEQEAWWNR